MEDSNSQLVTPPNTAGSSSSTCASEATASECEQLKKILAQMAELPATEHETWDELIEQATDILDEWRLEWRELERERRRGLRS